MGIAVLLGAFMGMCYSQFGQALIKSTHEFLNILFPVDYNIIKWR